MKPDRLDERSREFERLNRLIRFHPPDPRMSSYVLVVQTAGAAVSQLTISIRSIAGSMSDAP
jgi:hypothetical protein